MFLWRVEMVNGEVFTACAEDAVSACNFVLGHLRNQNKTITANSLVKPARACNASTIQGVTKLVPFDDIIYGPVPEEEQ